MWTRHGLGRDAAGTRRPPHLPTPLEPALRFCAEVGIPPLWIKRDDCTGLAFGGNKARKLEYLPAAARTEGADAIVTFGGVQSNHCRSAAAAARRLGMDCHLILAGSPPEETTGNLLLDRILGATMSFLSLSVAELTPARLQEAFQAAEERLRGNGRRPFRIPPGGSSPLGCLGYLRAFEETARQARDAGLRPSHILCAYGTGATLAGLVLGNVLAGRPVEVIGVSVAPPGMPEGLGVPSVEALVHGAASLEGRQVSLRPGDVRIRFEWAGRGYGVPTTEGIEAIRALARTEGIFLDPVYTGKAMAGLLGMVRSGEIGPTSTALFFHTGGTPGLFAYGRSLAP